MSVEKLILTSKDKLSSSNGNATFDVYVEERKDNSKKIKITDINIKLDPTNKTSRYGTYFLTIYNSNTYFQKEISITLGTETRDCWELIDNEQRNTIFTGGVLTVMLHNSTRNLTHVKANWSVTLSLSD
jgi:hypothetical protein